MISLESLNFTGLEIANTNTKNDKQIKIKIKGRNVIFYPEVRFLQL